jgi:hypothetical protein
VKIVKGWMPFFVKPLVLPVMTCFLDRKMLMALGYSAPPAWLKKMVNAAMRVRAWALKHITFRPYPVFFTSEPNRTYPNGYNIKGLGPTNLVRNLDPIAERRNAYKDLENDYE